MVYIRLKAAGNNRYAYLVRSVWDPENDTSHQKIIKYLGRTQDIRTGDIPASYRNDPKIRAFLAANAAGDGPGGGRRKVGEGEDAADLQDRAFNALIGGDLDGMMRIYDAHARGHGVAKFYEDVLKPAMYRIGSLWREKKLGIGDEHVASNTALELVGAINRRNRRPKNGHKVLICAPNGEGHSLACNVLQSFLQSRGYRVFNLSPSAPSGEIIRFVRESKPDIVLISITTRDHTRIAQRLVRKIRAEAEDMPVLVGGQALEGNDAKFDCDTVRDRHLGGILKVIRGKLLP